MLLVREMIIGLLELDTGSSLFKEVCFPLLIMKVVMGG